MAIFDKFTFAGQDLRHIQCGVCGTHHAIAETIYCHRLEEGGYWQCPNGHSWGYREGQHKRDEIRREHDRLLQERARLIEEAAEARRETEKIEKKFKRHQRRVAAGVCPCCKRTFAKLAMHMKSKHPEFGQVVPIGGAA